MERFKRCITGRHTAVEIRWHLAALAIVYWVLVFCAWLGYPSENKYSIMRDMLSELGSFDPHHNPEWFWVFSVAMIYCGLVMIPVMFYIRRRFKPVSEWGAEIGFFLMMLACIGIALTGAFPHARATLIGDWQWRHAHMKTAGMITVGFVFGVLWHGGLVLKDRLTRRQLAGLGRFPYFKVFSPFLICVPVFGAVGFKVQWGAALSGITSLFTSAQQTGPGAWKAVFGSLSRAPYLEHIAIWAVTIFIVWFAMVLPYELGTKEPAAEASESVPCSCNA